MSEDITPSSGASPYADLGEPGSGFSVPRETKDMPPFRYRKSFPWFRIFSLVSSGYLLFLIVYQVSPDFQLWVNYNLRYYGRYPDYFIRYAAWWLRQEG